jgi:hypothetical protein
VKRCDGTGEDAVESGAGHQGRRAALKGGLDRHQVGVRVHNGCRQLRADGLGQRRILSHGVDVLGEPLTVDDVGVEESRNTGEEEEARAGHQGHRGPPSTSAHAASSGQEYGQAAPIAQHG